MQVTKVLGLAAVGALLALAAPSERAKRCRSAIPVRPQRFSRTSGRTRQRCDGGTMVGIADGIVTIAGVITVTGAVGERGVSSHVTVNRPVDRGSVLHYVSSNFV